MTAPSVLSPFSPPETAAPNGNQPPAQVRAEVMEITPEMARAWMERHRWAVEENRIANGGKARDNRPIRWDDVAGFARDMKAGKWDLNGQTVKIAWDETVPDGQHRLYGCMEAQVPFRSLVVFGVDPETQDTMDTGARRTMADQLAIGNEKNAVVLASVTRWSLRWLRGVRGGTVRGGSFNPTNAEMLEYLSAVPVLRDAADFGVRGRHSFRAVRASVYAMGWMLFHGIDGLAAQVFMERLLDGAELPPGSPVLAFRTRMTNAALGGERLTEAEQLALMIMAWNAFREDRRTVLLKLPPSGLTAKNFPEPK